jgi:hypothetical protein
MGMTFLLRLQVFPHYLFDIVQAEREIDPKHYGQVNKLYELG